MGKTYCILLFFTLLGLSFVRGQNAQISVIDANTKQALPYANVCFEPLDKSQKPLHSITGLDGTIKNPNTGPVLCAVSHLGYASFIDTLQAGVALKVLLKPVAIQMKQVAVSAQIIPRMADKSIYKIKMINEKMIRKKAANDLGELLKGESNIRISQDAALGSSMSIQGLSGEHVKILVDGVPVNGRMDGNIDLGQLNLAQADHVEMIEGPMSVIYGSNALAGAINIITKQNQMHKRAAGANLYYESVGVYNADAWLSIKNGRSSFNLSGGRKFFGGWDPDENKRNQLWKPKRQLMADGQYIYHHYKFDLRISASAFDEELRSKGSPLPPYGETAYDAYFHTRRYRTSLHSTFKISHIRKLKLLAAVSYYERRKDTWFKDLVHQDEWLSPNPEDLDTTRFVDYIARTIYTKGDTAKKLNYQFGIDLAYETGRGKRIDGNEQEIGDYAAFFSLNYRPAKNFELQPGFRIAHNTRYSPPLVYSINAIWSPNNLNFRASFARGFRAPGLKELYLRFVDVNHNIIGNKNLKAEESYNFQTGLDAAFKEMGAIKGASIQLFYNDIDNIISLAQSAENVYTYINLDESRTMGGNIQLSVSPFDKTNFKLGAGITAYRSSLDVDNATNVQYLSSTDLTASFDWELFNGLMDVALYYKYTGKLPQYYVNAEGALSKGEISDYQMLDASINIPLQKDRISLAFGGKNLFNVQDVQVSGAASSGAHSGGGNSSPVGWGRTFYTRLSFKIVQ